MEKIITFVALLGFARVTTVLCTYASGSGFGGYGGHGYGLSPHPVYWPYHLSSGGYLSFSNPYYSYGWGSYGLPNYIAFEGVVQRIYQ